MVVEEITCRLICGFPQRAALRIKVETGKLCDYPMENSRIETQPNYAHEIKLLNNQLFSTKTKTKLSSEGDG